jgi:DNA-directed RNA polymerase specialized sigma24 family protein
MALFPTTHWSLLAKASLDGNTEGRKALEELCRRYWGPVHQFVRCRGVSETEAQDLTQDFILHVLEKSVFSRADRLQGRFRSFLLGALVRFLADKADQRGAIKRGGGVQHVSFDSDEHAANTQSDHAPRADTLVFDREWALAILETALARVRHEYAEARREGEFAVLKGFLPGGTEPPSYEAAAGQLDRSVPAFKSEVHRMRRRFRALVREEVLQTVSAPHEIDAEMAHLQQVLMDKGSEFGAAGET